MPRQPQRQTPEVLLAEQIQAAILEVEALADNLSAPASRKTRTLLESLKLDIERVSAALDPIKEPTKWFDPADPSQAGRLVAVALLAQPRVPLELIPRTYGAGVYAIYYHGDHPAYLPLSGTETPVYVGKADPKSNSAKSARDQGDQLFGRLSDHRKMIRTASEYAVEKSLPNGLSLEDFTCRKLVTATHAQVFAESHLISAFTPIWNKETRICWGISMHGDTAGRNNPRPPWDVMHPGRAWAMAKPISRPAERILEDLQAHFVANPPFQNRDQIIDNFLDAFAQDPMLEIKASS